MRASFFICGPVNSCEITSLARDLQLERTASGVLYIGSALPRRGWITRDHTQPSNIFHVSSHTLYFTSTTRATNYLIFIIKITPTLGTLYIEIKAFVRNPSFSRSFIFDRYRVQFSRRAGEKRREEKSPGHMHNL